MDLKNMGALVAGLVVSVILLAAVLVPVVNTSTTTEQDFDNTDYARSQMTAIKTGDTWTRTDSTWYYGEESITSNAATTYSILFTDTLVVRESGGTRGAETLLSNNNVSSVEAVAVDDSTLGISINQDTTYINYTYGYGAVPEGDLIMKTMTDSAYVLGDTKLYLTGSTVVANNVRSEVMCVITGSIDDGFTVTTTGVYGATITDLTTGEITVNAEAVDGYENLYRFTSIGFTISGTYSDATVSIDATYGTFVMPKIVTAELSTHPDTTLIALLNIIPMLVTVGIIVGIVGYVFVRRE